MLEFLDFDHFFQRPLVPIEEHDRIELEAIYPSKDGRPRGFTHWLIALMWMEGEGGCGWKVIVFPVSEKKVFWFVPPLFHTHTPSTFLNAWKLSDDIKLCSLLDQLTDKYANPYWDDWSSLEASSKEGKGCST